MSENEPTKVTPPSVPVGTDYSHQVKTVLAAMRLHLRSHPNQWTTVAIPMGYRQAHQAAYRARGGRPPWIPKDCWGAKVVPGKRPGTWFVQLRFVPTERVGFRGGSEPGSHLARLPSPTTDGVATTPVEKGEPGTTPTLALLEEVEPGIKLAPMWHYSQAPENPDAAASNPAEEKLPSRDSDYWLSTVPKTSPFCVHCLGGDHGYCSPDHCECGCVPR